MNPASKTECLKNTSNPSQQEASKQQAGQNQVEEALRQMFEGMDEDNSGTLSKEEVIKAYLKANPNADVNKITKLVEDCDKDKNGDICWEEFLAHFTGAC
ncbi:calhepatin-like isoform X2 [Protopterus annectens]|uniref:calhepatin-like isoform X2 n=1 Tax=Protopterus annectens TaxID=7888 RepID=UPI001CFBA366|nr:calhepatin-like isoform X2 [Protopterus annectens]